MLHKKPRIRRAFILLLCALFLVPALPSLAAQPQYRESWVPSSYTSKTLNVKDFCTVSTEYPVYKTGTESLYLVIKNETSKQLSYGAPYVLEKKQAGRWYAQQIKSTDPNEVIGWPSIGYIVAAKQTRADQIHLYKPLADGEYRIVKNIGYEKTGTEASFAAYFTVASTGYDSTLIAGYVPLSSLKAAYTQEQALADGVFYVDAKGKVFNSAALLTFLTKVHQGAPARLRMLQYGIEGQFIITDITKSNTPAFLLEQCTLHDPMQQNIYLENGKPLNPNPEKSSIFSRYYPFLITQQVSGKTRLLLSDWFGTPVKEADTWTILANTSLVGRSNVAKLLENPYGLIAEPEYRVYNGNTDSFASYWLDGKKRMLYYTETAYSLGMAELTESRGILKDILSMEWSNPTVLKLTFTTSVKNLKCIMTFDTAAGKVTDTRYE